MKEVVDRMTKMKWNKYKFLIFGVHKKCGSTIYDASLILELFIAVNGNH